MKNTFYYKGEQFYFNGEKIQIRSGAIHYFRVPRFYWKDRLQKLKECGFNCVETYVAWNVSEPHKNEFDFSGDNDIAEFIRLARELGLLAIVRPGPFICAEWEGGGLPAWLKNDFDEELKGLQLRCDNPPFMSRCEKYLTALFSEIHPYFLGNGGNIVMMQVENEYGSYGNDKVYLKKLVDIYRKNGVDAVLFTADGGGDATVFAGNFPEECLTTLTFGSGVKKGMNRLTQLAKGKPKMCAEFWCGWFDHWGEKHHVRGGESVVVEVDEFMKNGWNFNFYMFCGGTNFAFMNGSNFEEYIQPTVTSYDYCALLTERGARTDTYYKIRELFAKYGVEIPKLTAADGETRGYGTVKFSSYAYLFDNLTKLSSPITSKMPLAMENLGQNYGYAVYRCTADNFPAEAELRLNGLADRANVFLNGEFAGRRESTASFDRIAYSIEETEAKQVCIDVLVENMGHINYGYNILDKKGLGGLLTYYKWVYSTPMNWLNYSLPMDYAQISKARFVDNYKEIIENRPVFLKGTFSVDNIADCYVKPIGLHRGFIIINGVNIGRYDCDKGPQKNYYLPACYLKEGRNEVILFESDSAAGNIAVELVDYADYGEAN